MHAYVLNKSDQFNNERGTQKMLWRNNIFVSAWVCHMVSAAGRIQQGEFSCEILLLIFSSVKNERFVITAKWTY